MVVVTEDLKISVKNGFYVWKAAADEHDDHDYDDEVMERFSVDGDLYAYCE